MNQIAKENATYRTNQMQMQTQIHTHITPTHPPTAERNSMQQAVYYCHGTVRCGTMVRYSIRTLAKPLMSTTVFPVATRRLAAS